jgi:hypothetical protein
MEIHMKMAKEHYVRMFEKNKIGNLISIFQKLNQAFDNASHRTQLVKAILLERAVMEKEKQSRRKIGFVRITCLATLV